MHSNTLTSYADAVRRGKYDTVNDSEHHMVSTDVCDSQEPARSTFFGRDIDLTLCANVSIPHV